GDAGAATQVGPDVFRSQLRVSAWTFGASGGGSGAAVHRRRLSLGGGSGSREVLRPGQSRQTDGKDCRTGERQEVIEADPGFSASRSDGGRAGKSGGRRDPARRAFVALVVEHRARRVRPGVTTARAPVCAVCGRLCATSAKGRGGPNVCNCWIDEGRPLGTGWQEQVPNHLRRLWTKAMVVSTEGKGLERTRSGDWQEEDRKGTTDDMSKA